MKVGLLSDIHGNVAALNACLDVAARAGIGRLLIAGDFVGYYYSPAEVLTELDRFQWDGVRGNHERLLDEWLAGHRREWIRKTYGSGISIAANMPEKSRDRYLSLESQNRLAIAGKRVLVCHGSPWDEDAYVYPDAAESVRQRMSLDGIDLVLFGHTHYQVTWCINQTRVVNPGSVGQPRDHRSGACWAIWDTDDMTIEQRRETYDPSDLLAMCRQHDPHLPYLIDVLSGT